MSEHKKVCIDELSSIWTSYAASIKEGLNERVFVIFSTDCRAADCVMHVQVGLTRLVFKLTRSDLERIIFGGNTTSIKSLFTYNLSVKETIKVINCVHWAYSDLTRSRLTKCLDYVKLVTIPKWFYR